ncbi:hypothetical protein FDECE_5090 [Fusarium decemcellulare]|nr:hypothetical protein FDECE_5090 [Fusarium decemcellulare]
MSQLIWLITATTSGLGSALVENVVARGDKVIATGRRAAERLSHLKSDNVEVIDLDVTSTRAEIDTQVKKAWDVWGRIDILVNNAGVIGPKSIEEAGEDFVRNVFDVNFFGAMHITQSILPYFRAQKHGTITFTGAGFSWGPLPLMVHYSASKAALGCFVEGLAKEVRQFNINCTIFEAGGFASQLGVPRPDWNEGFGVYYPSISAYEPLFNEVMGVFANEIAPNIPGDAKKLAERIVDCVKGEGICAGRQLPVRVILGSDSFETVKQKCKEQLEIAEKWEEISLSTDRDGRDPTVSPGMLRFSSIL